MKLSRLHSLVRAALESSGDLDVVIMTDGPAGTFSALDNPNAATITAQTDSGERLFFAVGWPTALPLSDDDDLKPKLRSV